MSVAVVSDTCHYLPPGLAAAEGIHQVSLYVRWPEGDQRESEISDYDAYYARLKDAPELPKHLTAVDRRLPRRVRAAARFRP